jgi:hypothetical protein
MPIFAVVKSKQWHVLTGMTSDAVIEYRCLSTVHLQALDDYDLLQ